MNSIKQILAIASVGMLLINCPKSKDNDDDLLLGLALLSQQGGPVFTPTTPAFTLADGESAFYSAGPWGESSEKFTIPAFARETAVDLEISFTNTDGYVKLFFNVENNLLNGGGTQGETQKIHYTQVGFSAVEGYVGNAIRPIRNGTLNTLGVTTDQAVTRKYCFETHREIEGGANCGWPGGPACSGTPDGSDTVGNRPGPTDLTLSANENTRQFRKVEVHHIGWAKACNDLTTADRGSYAWERKGDADSTNSAAYPGTLVELSRWANGKGVGYISKNAIVKITPYKQKFATAGSFR
ncbi:MAG: hypothetical protein JJT78_12945 [Leptospira sp.]|nr:hypothetical protein [Leptospira sp.]